VICGRPDSYGVPEIRQRNALQPSVLLWLTVAWFSLLPSRYGDKGYLLYSGGGN